MASGLICATLFFAAVAWPVWGSSTQDVRIEGSGSFLEGNFSAAGLSHLGELVTGLESSKVVPAEDAGYVLTSAVFRDRVYYGCGVPATVVTADGKSAVVRAKFGGDIAVSAMASDGRHLYAAVMPTATIYKIDDKGNTMPFTDFSTGAVTPNYVWSMTIYRGSIYTALGGHFPSVYKIDLKTAKKELLHQLEGKAKNVTALAVTDDGIFFGDDNGRVFRLQHDAKDRATVLYSFSDAEIRSIVPFERGLALAVNSRRFIPPPPQAPPSAKDQPKPADGQIGDEGELGLGMDLRKAIEAVAASVDAGLRPATGLETESPEVGVNGKAPVPPVAAAKVESPGAQPPAFVPAYQDPFGKGEGNLFWMALDGSEVHRLWFSQSSVVLSILPEGNFVWVATSNPARLYRIGRDSSERLYYESTSKDLSVVASTGKAASAIQAAASNPAVLLELKAAGSGAYSSKVFDAGFPARIGRPEVLGHGSDGSDVSYRSGSTADIDSGWTAFRPLGGAFPQVSGRFFQIKVKLKSEQAAIRRIRIPYRIQNLHPRLINLSADVARGQDGSADGKEIRFQWDVLNLDNDALLYQISYQPPGGDKFIPLFEPGGQPRAVKTAGVPSESFTDGTYRFRLEVTDEPTNGKRDALASQAEFPVVLLDRMPPSVDLRQEDRKVRWQATDAASRIVRAEARIDGGLWQALTPDDGLFDSPQESGIVDPPKSGTATVVDVRCFDERENTRTYSLILK